MKLAIYAARISLLCLCSACQQPGSSTIPNNAGSSAAQTVTASVQSGAPSGAAAGASATPPAAAAPHAAGGDMLPMPPLDPGYQRFVGPPIEVPAGVSNDWMQWVDGPMDQDYDVSEMKGAQSRIGHHAILYTSREANAVGMTRIW